MFRKGIPRGAWRKVSAIIPCEFASFNFHRPRDHCQQEGGCGWGWETNVNHDILEGTCWKEHPKADFGQSSVYNRFPAYTMNAGDNCTVL